MTNIATHLQPSHGPLSVMLRSMALPANPPSHPLSPSHNAEYLTVGTSPSLVQEQYCNSHSQHIPIYTKLCLAYHIWGGPCPIANPSPIWLLFCGLHRLVAYIQKEAEGIGQLPNGLVLGGGQIKLQLCIHTPIRTKAR